MKYVYWFEEISKDSLGIAGGKGANLGEMANSGFPIPPGFVIGGDSYYEYIKLYKIDKLITDILTPLDVDDTKKLNEAAEKMSAAIMAGTIPKEMADQIVDAYESLKKKTGADTEYVAVRSSATAEDLPTASFAGEQASFLNVYGDAELLESVKMCWASLFTPRSIFYRVEQGFDHLRVKLAVVIQHMVQSEKSGVFFTVNPIDQDVNNMMIEAGYGLGEAVVSGSITPDTYTIQKQSLAIIDKRISKQDWMITKVGEKNVKANIKKDFQQVQKLTDQQIQELAKIGRNIEKHYGWPQDIEWAVEGGKIFIVQSRPITTLKKEITEKFTLASTPGGKDVEMQETKRKETTPQLPSSNKLSIASSEPALPGEMVSISKAKVILKGLPASPGFSTNRVRLLLNLDDMSKMQSGEILVTTMTTPDFVPAMRRASAIITDAGGLTSHAAIVSRELGVPAVIGTGEATKKLQDGMIVTVDATKGIVYEGKVDLSELAKPGASVTGGGEYVPVTATKIYVNVAEPDVAEKVAKLSVDGVGLLRAEFMVANMGVHPRKMFEEGRSQEFIDNLSEGLSRIAGAFFPRPVVYRATDFKTNEYRNLEGGEKYEPQEDNPMIGYRGAMRYIREPELFELELKAIKKVREDMGLKNLWLMIPFVRRTEQIIAIKRMMEAQGLHRTKDFKLWIMVEVPSSVLMIEEMCEEGIDGVSIGSNDLTQLILGVDRDNATISGEFDERSTAVLRALRQVIRTCREHGVTASICGQAPSVYPEFTEKLVDFGTTSVSVNPDVIDKTRRIVAAAEQKFLLDKTRKIIEKLGLDEGDVKHTLPSH